VFLQSLCNTAFILGAVFAVISFRSAGVLKAVVAVL